MTYRYLLAALPPRSGVNIYPLLERRPGRFCRHAPLAPRGSSPCVCSMNRAQPKTELPTWVLRWGSAAGGERSTAEC